MTPEEIGQGYGKFYSAVHDRSDVTEESFTLSPGEGDSFRMVVDGSPSISSLTTTKKERSGDGRRLDITTETTYRLRGVTLATTTVPVRVKILPKWKGWSRLEARLSLSGRVDTDDFFRETFGESLEIEVPVVLNFQSMSTTLEQGLGQELKAFGSGPHVWELEVFALYDLEALSRSVQRDLLQRFLDEGLEIYNDLLWTKDLSERTALKLGVFSTWVRENLDPSALTVTVDVLLSVKRIDDIKVN